MNQTNVKVIIGLIFFILSLIIVAIQLMKVMETNKGVEIAKTNMDIARVNYEEIVNASIQPQLKQQKVMIVEKTTDNNKDPIVLGEQEEEEETGKSLMTKEKIEELLQIARKQQDRSN